jgi:threonine dehydratase
VPIDASLTPAVQPDDITLALQRIRQHVRQTPIITAHAGELGLPVNVTLKLELMQHAGSFKSRGAFNRVLCAVAAGEVGPAGLIAASGGNHGAAIAFVGRQLGFPAEIFMPSSSPTIKRDRIASYGAEVHVIDGYFDDAQAAATVRQRETGALAVHPFEHVDVIAGQGTMAVELDGQVGEYDTLVVATGGGGFIAGQAAWVQHRRRVVSVEPVTSCCLLEAKRNGSPVPVSVSGVAADSLGTGQLGALAWSVVRDYVDEAVVVHDDDIRSAQRALWDELRLVVEPGGAAALAALRCGAYVPAAGERVVVAVCGSNCDPNTVTS